MSTEELRSSLNDIRNTLSVVITALEGLARRFDRIEEEGCRFRKKHPTGPSLPSLFKEGCGGNES